MSFDWSQGAQHNISNIERINLGGLIRSPSVRPLYGGGKLSLVFTFFCLRLVALVGSSISCSRTCIFWVSDACYGRSSLLKTSTTLCSVLNCSLWLISCWCHPRMYTTGKGLSKIFTELRYFLFILSS